MDCTWHRPPKFRNSRYHRNFGESKGKISETEQKENNTKSCFCFCSIHSQFILEMMGELYTVHEMPEQPKEGFFKGLFGGGAKPLDREELCTYHGQNRN